MPRYAPALLQALLIASFLAMPGPATAADPAARMELTPTNVMRHIQSDGARLTVNRLRGEKSGSKSNYEWVILKVESGELIWLQIADDLLPGLEPSYQHDMFISGARAMGRHPENAVRLLKGKRWPLEYLCDAPFESISQHGWEEHLLKVQKGLRRFEHPSFQREKELCLRYIDWALERYPQPVPRELRFDWHVPQDLP